MSERPEDLDAAMQAFLDAELVEAGLVQVGLGQDGSGQTGSDTSGSDTSGAGRPFACEPDARTPCSADPKRQDGPADGTGAAPSGFRRAVADIAAKALKIPPDRLDVRENMSRYGVDSILVTEIMSRISDALAMPIAPTVFFEAKHLEELADILYRRYGTSVSAAFGAETTAKDAAVLSGSGRTDQLPDGLADSIEGGAEAERWIETFRAIAASGGPVRAADASGYEPVAIIAMEGLFAESGNLHAFEANLREGNDCIREVPAGRWNWRDVFGDPKRGEWTNVKYGGFAPDIDTFDASFFGISPREAELMDPQHRLFIQCVWRLIETAGYAPKSLAGRKVGMFIGINLQDYAHLIDRAGAIEAAHLTALGHMFCPNRLSFHLDIHGPSQVIDTACSSSLVALHRAVLSVQHEGCEMAIAGGANLMISPDMHIMYSKLGMICEDGRCKTFSRHANGYARGDGVGAVLLKPLSHAERDGDSILAVIRGSAENHGGMSTSLTAPNPKAQASVIVEAHRKAGLDPRSVGYVECHGTGTPLGDPIEINGLKMAFEALHRSAGLVTPEVAYCGLGSVKSNIGHAETAAGIAGVIKTVLAIRNRQLFPTLHAGDVNPMIELEGSPFFIVQQGRAWTRPIVDGAEQPRRAGVSSFGAGGSNAHVVIEEYVGVPPPVKVRRSAPSLILLSARSEDRLRDVIRDFIRFLEGNPDEDIVDIAYTLQVGRDAMEHRLAVVADTVAALQEKLARLDRGGDAVPDCTFGTIQPARGTSRAPAETVAAPETIDKLFAEGSVRPLAALWTAGCEINWPALYATARFDGRRPRRVNLPAYPFARQRYWIPGGAAGRPDTRRRDALPNPVLHPLLHRNTSDLSEQRFSSEFTGREFFLADHVVLGQKVLPGAAYLEMARAAVAQASAVANTGQAGIRLKNVVWSRPFAVGDQPASLHIGLQRPQNDQIAYRIYSTPGDAHGEPVLHGQGTAIPQETVLTDASASLDVDALRAAITNQQPDHHRLDARQCYEAFRAMGLAYGPGHRGLEHLYFSASTVAPQVLAKVALPAAFAHDAAQFVLHPGLIDSALQACIGLVAASGRPLPGADYAGGQTPAASLPFALDELELTAQPTAAMWVWIRYADGYSPTSALQKLDIDLFDDHGRIAVRMRGFSSRAPEPTQEADVAAMVMTRPVWVDRAVADHAAGPVWSRHTVMLCDLDGALPQSIEGEIAAAIPGASCVRLHLSGEIADWYGDAAVSIFAAIKGASVNGDAGRTLIQAVAPERGDARLLSGLSGLLATANRESTRVFAQLITLDTAQAGRGLSARLMADGRSPEARIRYRDAARQVLQWQDADRAPQSDVIPWKDNGVYLITGGSGGLGLLFAAHIGHQARNATVVLCGRSEPGAQARAEIDRLSEAGLSVRFRRLDVSSRSEVERLVADIVRTSGRLDGVLHCAGLLRDNFITKKTAQEFRDVLAPKVAGTLHLDAATAHLDLDFFALFSSAAGALGSAGQADYAAANGFMDAFAHHRNGALQSGRRHGRTVSINWPLWADGGMRMEPAALAMMAQATGMEALPRQVGLGAFDEIMASGAPQTLVLFGRPDRVRQTLRPARGAANGAAEALGNFAVAAPAAAPDTAALAQSLAQMLLQAVAGLMKFELKDLDAEGEWSDFGFDSISLTEFANRLNQQHRLELTPTVFFEYPSVAALAGWLAAEHGSAFAPARAAAPETPPRRRSADDGSLHTHAAPPKRNAPADTAVAIVGMSGRFPMARDLDGFWANLVAGRDCISEIPPDRWDWRALDGDAASDASASSVKWGGFIDGVGDFDARFFNISPREALLMDPQQRLLMQYAWKAIEDAGYSAQSLSGSNTAIFVGTAPSGYGMLVAQSGSAIDSHSSTGAVGSIGPNRMSYFLNVHGPSEPIETACSSSLVAIHRAVAAIANGDCEQAIVGGINLIVSPETHISFSRAGMLCPDGRCKTFSKDANGYVRGEGVGMLFLKTLAAAERAGDHIYGVIRASAENHGGRGNSLTAPNPKAQAALITTAYARSGVDPRTVGYIEAHGTGTALGDPIEVDGLKAAFRDLYASTGSANVGAAHCGLGSVKTNIGHLELAAGVAGVIKVLLQLKHKTLVRSLHCDAVNPYIRLQDSPFYLVHENRAWEPIRDDEGRELPRRAGVSSFGFGGVNAHIVIEEYRQDRDEDSDEPEGRADASAFPSLVLLSAKDPTRLKAYASDVLAFVAARVTADAGDAGAGRDPARSVLVRKMRSAVANILQVDESDIDPKQPLDAYGFEPVHRTMLQDALKTTLDLEIGARPFFDNHCVASIAADVLGRHPTLRDRLDSLDATRGQEQAGPADLQRREDSADRPAFALADLAYTLQVGREPMAARLAVVVRSGEELVEKLRAFVEDRAEKSADIHVGQKDSGIAATFGADEELQEALDKWMQRGKFSRLLDLWSRGLNLDWEKLYGPGRPYPFKPRRMSAPGYPFAEQRYWIEEKPLDQGTNASALDRATGAFAPAAPPAQLHPLLHENVSTLQRARFRAHFDGREFFLADHRMRGQKVLPGVAYLEMVRAAVTHAAPDAAGPDAVLRLRDVAWIRPAVVDRQRCITIDLTADAQGVIRYEATSGSGSEAQVHSQGSASFQAVARPPRLDPEAVRACAGMTAIDVRCCYELFGAAGLDYGPAHRGIDQLHAGGGQALAKLVLPGCVASTLDQYVLHPSLMDCALQSSIGLVLADPTETASPSPKLALPFAVESVAVFGTCTRSMWAWIRHSPGGVRNDRLQKLDIDLCDEHGQVRVAIRGFSSRLVDGDKAAAKPVPAPVPQRDRLPPSPVDGVELKSRTIAYFKEQLAAVLKFPIDDIEIDEPLDSYGIDSMTAMELTDVLERPFGPLSKTLLFEHQTLAELVDYFIDTHRPQLLALFDEGPSDVPAANATAATAPSEQPAPLSHPRQRVAAFAPTRAEAGALDIAVIGLSGRYPQSPDIEAFWRNLRDGRDCITEVPSERWDWRAFYGEDADQAGRHTCKWGGFIEDADKFDPLFFNISPSTAEYMDPQERLFLEHAWTALEDAGWRREDLRRPRPDVPDDEDLPAQVGVYAGVMYSEYQLLGLGAGPGGATSMASTNFYASVANRVSYALNLHGPSMAVDTMCSSSLTAIHLACQDLKLCRTDLALAGGVNLSLHPGKYSLLSLGQFISTSGKCESFGAGGDGYVPSEGVGVVVLKRLADAERDGDHIYGVIKSSALNHGGKTNGYSVPNPKAQRAAVSRALREAGLDPRAIGYIEAHGTGTRLGDPIEIAGLAKAFGHSMAGAPACFIGSSKSNIGHSEAAAGIAGLTKVLLQMREGQIAPSLHSRALNPNIDFPSTPFEVNQYLRDWPRRTIDGHTHLRAAGISSFGAGGANAHLIVEEYPRPDAGIPGRPRIADGRCVVVLSARTEAQLRDYAERLARFIGERQAEERCALSLRDVAYTLQVGREAMQYRLGFVAASLGDAADRLGRFLAGEPGVVHAGRAKAGSGAQPPPGANGDALIASWVGGAGVDWMQLYADQDALPSRISLPTYPFARERYWTTPPEPRVRVEVQDRAEARDRAEPGDQPARTQAADTSPVVGDEGTRDDFPSGDGLGDTLMLRPTWAEQPIQTGATETVYQEHRVLCLGGLPEIANAITMPLRPIVGTADQCFVDIAAQLFGQIKDIIQRKPTGPVLLQVVVAAEQRAQTLDDDLYGALAAMLKTARMEQPHLVGQLIALDADASRLDPAELALLLRDNGNAPAEPHVRYRRGRREVPLLAELEGGARPPRPVWREGGRYLITGGAGGLGLIFARDIVRRVRNVELVLTGRSSLNDASRASIDALRAEGARIDYRRVDVSDPEAVRALVASLGGTLNGIIHSAGIIRDSFILKKPVQDLRNVLAAKVSGVVNLDLASRSIDLDFLVLFSSLAGAVGNPGQADYATANAFLDCYAAYRNRLATGSAADQTGLARPKGHTLSINWPLWQDGGMGLDAESTETMRRTTGLSPLRTHAGIAAFDRALDSGCDQVVALAGDLSRLRGLFIGRQPEAARPEDVKPDVTPAGSPPQDGASDARLIRETETLITKMLSDMLKLPIHRIEVDVPLEQYGIDSVAMTTLISDLEQRLGPLSKTLLFEHPTIEAVSAHLAGLLGPQLAALFGPAPAPAPTPARPAPVVARAPAPTMARSDATTRLTATPEPVAAASTGVHDIAVIGMSGRFPQANDLAAFWQNLSEGRDCITEVPADRWDHGAYYDPDKDTAGKTSCKWGGFLDDVDRFDAAFFKISPGEAEVLDPQEKLFLETVWNLFESSGYLGETLQRLCQSRVGVFVGSMSQQHHAWQSDLVRESLVILSSPSSIANRVSYYFNLKGPSLAIDTMCSSALNAVHMACQSLIRGECKVAVAGGVNLTIHPKKYIGLSAGKLIGSHPDSTSFGAGDGYLPAEAVGAVLLKPLRDAMADGDNVLALIKSTAVNHAGQSNGYRVPNGSAQADLIAENFARSGIDPRSVSYVESAANGSPLGDAIELNALTEAFRRATDARQFCAIGSVKSNIGHAEAASGISQLIKVILQLQHRKLVPTIKAAPLNPNIAFEETPFYLQRRLEDWQRPVIALRGGSLHEYPRRAAVSSFGAGGSNVHLIVEEFEAANGGGTGPQPNSEPELIVLSARTAGQRQAVAQSLLAFVEERPDLSITDLAYTLQTARETMDYRLALVVDSREELIGGLQAYVRDDAREAAAARVFVGDSEQDTSGVRTLVSGKTGQATLAMLLAERDFEKLAFYWVHGVRIAWHQMPVGTGTGPGPRRIVLPSYPFDRKPHRLSGRTASEAPAGPPAAEKAAPFAVDPQRSVRENIERYLAQSLRSLLGLSVDTARADKTFLDYGVDSITLLKLQRGLEETFQVKISSQDVLAHPTPATLAEFAAVRHAGLQGEGDATAGVVTAGPAPALSPLTEGQKGLWLLHQLAPGMSAYNVPVALSFDAGLDASLFRQACAHVLRRFPVLGAVFERIDGALWQRYSDTAALHFEHERTDAASEAEIIALLRMKSKQPFDLEQGPLVRVHLLSADFGNRCYALLTVHHIVFDGRSAVLVIRELLDAYRLLAAGRTPELPTGATSYGDFVRWQERFMVGAPAASQLAYWKTQLSGDLPMLSLPFDRPRPAKARLIGASHDATVSADLARKIKAVAGALQVTPSTVFLGALKLMLHRYCGDDDILVGMPTLGRPESRFDDVVGYFANMIVIRSRISRTESAADFLKALQATIAESLDNADYPFPALLSELKIDRGAGASPLGQVVFGYQAFMQPADRDDLRDAAGAAASMTVLPGVNQEGGHDLALEVYQSEDGFRLSFCYDTDLFAPETITAAMTHYIRLLGSISLRPSSLLDAHDMLAPEDLQRITTEWGGEDAASVIGESGIGGSLVESFQRQAARTPDKTAIRFGDAAFSYRDLDRRSTHLASLLLDRGLTDGDRIAVCVERGLDMIVAMLAIWKACAVYVPIAPDCPPERLGYVLDDSGARLLISNARTREGRDQPDSASGPARLAMGEVQWETPGSPAATGGAAKRSLPTRAARPEDAAYVIYTSGSTGQPKGVVIPHRAIGHHCQVMREIYRLTPEDQVLQFAPMHVDASLEQILPALHAGATVVVRPGAPWSAATFRREVARLGITVIDVPPSYLHELLVDARSASDWTALRSVRLAIVGGEPLRPETLDAWRASPMRECRLLNAYGPTETTITSTVCEVGSDRFGAHVDSHAPIGRPLPGERAYILDAHGQAVPAGVAGELHIGGAGLAIGYLNQPELTERAFIENPIRPGERVYRTGDLARWREDGTIVFLGRRDHQIKVRGFRVECGEVEAALRALDGIEQAVVLSRPFNGRDHLVAFVVGGAEVAGIAGHDLKRRLSATLPEHMIPTVVVPLAQLPLTPGGKVDRAALTQQRVDLPRSPNAVGPRTPAEAQLADIWRDVLGIERVGVYDNFFELGGHSLLAVRLGALIHKQFGQDLPISSLLEAPDIARQAQILDDGARIWSPLVRLQPNGDKAPWFCVHAVSGNVLPYRALAGHMGARRAFYALQAPDVATDRHPGTVEGLAALYIEAIRAVQPDGPYHLGGWSMGGVVAYEMARQLRRAGEQVATLALIDSYVPEAAQAFESDRGREDALLAAFARELGVEDAATIAARTDDDADGAHAHTQRLLALFQANVGAMNRYVPGGYDGCATLFAAEGADGTLGNGPYEGPYDGWSKVIEGKLKIVGVPGDHYSVLKEPNVQRLSAALVAALDGEQIDA